MKIVRRSTKLAEPFIVEMQKQEKGSLKILYFTDCVFNPIVYQPDFQLAGRELKIDFGFISDEVQKYPRIYDNIGVLNFMVDENLVCRLGILVTKEKGQIYISLLQ